MIAFHPDRRALPRCVALLCIAWTAGSLTGCGSTASVEGRVTRNGRPVRGTVWFVRERDGKKLDAPIGTDGVYRVEGAPAGTVKVTVVPPFMEPPPTAANKAKHPSAPVDKYMLDPNADQEASRRDTVLPPARYASLETSGLSTTLNSGTANRFDIPLNDE